MAICADWTIESESFLGWSSDWLSACYQSLISVECRHTNFHFVRKNLGPPNRTLPQLCTSVTRNRWHSFADPSLKNTDFEHCVLVTSWWLAPRIWISSFAYVEVAVRDGDQIGIVISRSHGKALKVGLQILVVFSHWVYPHSVLDRRTGFNLARQRCLPSWGPRRTPWFFCNFSTVWCGRLLKLCFLGFLKL